MLLLVLLRLIVELEVEVVLLGLTSPLCHSGGPTEISLLECFSMVVALEC